MVKIGEKIRTLRRDRGISQEVLAGALGVSFQSVSKWENELTMPDVAMIPAIAAFFDVSTDELFAYDRLRIEHEVEAIVEEHSRLYDTDRVKCEEVLREGLRRFPGNEILLNCLVGVIPVPERAEEVITLCRALTETARGDETRIDAWHIMAEAYASIGEKASAREAVEHIPEIYFTKLGTAARLLTGEERFRAAAKQATLSLSELLDMLTILADHYEAAEDPAKAAIKRRQIRDIRRAFSDDFPTPYTKAALEAYPENV